MQVWRIARGVHAALDGEGARLFGGRWNSPGTPVVYTAGSRALAILERLVPTDPEDLPDDLVLFQIEIPDSSSRESVSVATLALDWRRPRHAQCRSVGDEWAASGRSLVLTVPSSVVPEETNYLINPRHPEATAVRVTEERPFSFDLRLLR
jgi:RES domain-containing protein